MRAKSRTRLTFQFTSLVCCALFASLLITLIPFLESGSAFPAAPAIARVLSTDALTLAGITSIRTQVQAQSARSRQPGVLFGCALDSSQEPPLTFYLVSCRDEDVPSIVCVSHLQDRAPPQR